MKIRVLWPGKTKQTYLRQVIEDYSSRIRKFIPFEIMETKEYSVQDRFKSHRIAKESKSLSDVAKDTVRVIFDPSGKQISSEDFAAWIGKQNKNITFMIGGPAGLTIPNPDLKLSLGKWTFPHEIVRVLVLEQIYRALTILNNVPYHK